MLCLVTHAVPGHSHCLVTLSVPSLTLCCAWSLSLSLCLVTHAVLCLVTLSLCLVTHAVLCHAWSLTLPGHSLCA